MPPLPGPRVVLKLWGEPWVGRKALDLGRMKGGYLHIEGMGHTLTKREAVPMRWGRGRQTQTCQGSKAPRGCKMLGTLFPGALVPDSQFGRMCGVREKHLPHLGGIHTHLPTLYKQTCAQACTTNTGRLEPVRGPRVTFILL